MPPADFLPDKTYDDRSKRDTDHIGHQIVDIKATIGQQILHAFGE